MFFLQVLQENTHSVLIVFLHKVFHIFKKSKKHTKKKSDQYIKVLRSDKCMKYNSKEFAKFYKEEDVEQ